MIAGADSPACPGNSTVASPHSGISSWAVWKACPHVVVLTLSLGVAMPVTAEPVGTRKDNASSWVARAIARVKSPPLGLPSDVQPDSNPISAEKIQLGRKLFFDRRLSANGTMSCGMCHIPEQGFTNHELSTPIGVEGRSQKRNAPTLLNVAFTSPLFLDGRETSLEKQAIAPLLAHNEMGNASAEELIERIAALPDYEGLFEQAFGRKLSLPLIAKSIAAWERTLLAADSPFDRWHFGGVADAITEQQRKGFELFVGRARCVICHSIAEDNAMFTDQAFHDTGIGYLQELRAKRRAETVPVQLAPGVVVSVRSDLVAQVSETPESDLGRFEVTGRESDRWRYRTPTLRNIAVTGPYMHDGSLPTLQSVVEYYSRGGSVHRGIDPHIRPLHLEEREQAALVAFLHSLTAGNLRELQTDARAP